MEKTAAVAEAPQSDSARSAGRTIVFLVLAVAGFWFFLFPYAGNLIRDLRLSGTWQAAYDLQVADARCKRYNFVVTLCSAQLKSRARPDLPPVAIEFMMAFSRGSEALIPVRSTRDTNAVSLRPAVETHLANRTMTFLVLTAAFAGIFLICFLLLLAGNGGRHAPSDPARAAA